TTKERADRAVDEITLDLGDRIRFYEEMDDPIKAERIRDRVTYDVEMIKEVGYCSGIENYSRYFDGRKEGERPFCLLDCFPNDFLLIIDESHVTVPQLRGMSGGDRSRKLTLVEHGFRLPSALDNRPLRFEEFEALTKQVIYVSATPADYELSKCEGIVAEQLIRPTGLLDPPIEVRPSNNQIDDLLEEIQKATENDDRAIVTTFTKRLAEELDEYLRNHGVRSAYIHSDIDTLDRVRILDELRDGQIDVIVGVNLLREGIDLPEVALVAILDADKEGFLRNETSLTQTVGRAARNLRGKAILYADSITGSMRRTIEETERRRTKQMRYNAEHGITPTAIVKGRNTLLDNEQLSETRKQFGANAEQSSKKGTSGKGTSAKSLSITKEFSRQVADDSKIDYDSIPALIAEIEKTRDQMLAAAKALDFMEAARLRDYMFALEERKKLRSSTGNR
ncbi:MAG: UvrB/UvrC motif-containing protein, partial [Bacteroidales bacterium]|nr:UvrB/UvrC motif-containing protein [Bacteroidales bacterium]